MTTEEKAKAWDEAIERAKSKIRNDKDHVLYEEDILDIFPSLKESDEERIRKEIIEDYRSAKRLCREGEEGSKRILDEKIAWLEKHGEHSNFLSKIKIGDKVTRNEDGVLVNLSQLNRVAKKKGEQKPIEEVKPKFKVGDWVICKNGSHRVFQVIERSWPNAKYLDEKGVGGLLNVATLDKQYRPWTIKDAKAGDLLADDYGIYIFDRFFEYDEKSFYCKGAYQRSQKVYENEHLLCSVEVHPATKEQRDLLFQKMKEVGYEWDADKKESKEIEQKPQSTWKPSDRQMKAIEHICDGNYNVDLDILDSIYRDFKKLREE